MLRCFLGQMTVRKIYYAARGAASSMTLISSELHLHIAFRTLVFASKVELANTES